MTWFVFSMLRACASAGPMPFVTVSVKWKKEIFSDVQVDTDDVVSVLKMQLYTLSGSPCDCRYCSLSNFY